MDSVDQRLEVALARRGRVVMIVTARCEDVQRADDAVLADAGRIARIALVRSQVDRVGTDQPSVVFGLDARLVVIEAERLVVAQSVRNEDVGHHDDRVSRQFDVDRLEAARVFVDNRRPRNVLEVAPLSRPERGIEVGVVRVHAVDLRRALSRHVRSRPRSSVDAHSVAVALGDTAGRLLCDQRRQTGHRIGVERSRQVVGHRHVVADQPGRAVVSPGERRLEQAVLPGAARGRLGERFVGVGLEGRRKGKPIVCAHPERAPHSREQHLPLDVLEDRVDPLAVLAVSEDERVVAPHRVRIVLDHLQVGVDVRCEVRLVDDQQVGLYDARAALAGMSSPSATLMTNRK